MLRGIPTRTQFTTGAQSCNWIPEMLGKIRSAAQFFGHLTFQTGLLFARANTKCIAFDESSG